MKHYYTLLALLFLSHLVHSQGANEQLDINDALVRFYSNGLIGKAAGTGSLGYFVPADSSTSPLFASGIWIAGVDEDGQLRVAAHFYGVDQDLYPGPLSTDGTAAISQETSQVYDQIWKINRSDVLLHRSYYECAMDPECDEVAMFPDGYEIPTAFSTWPAHGDPDEAQAYDLAPYHDMSSDNAYDAGSGDHPCVPGDQALYMIFNDMAGPHGTSSGLPLGMEVHMMPFAYTGQDPAMEQTIFIQYRLINRSDRTLNNLFIGTFADIDIGCYSDDFIGSDVGRNMVFCYNWDDIDASCSGFFGYNETPPAFGVVTLKGPLVDPNGVDDDIEFSLPSYNGLGFNDGVIDNECHGLSRMIYFNREGNSSLIDPQTPEHYHNYLQAIWKDGTPMSYGGNGYSTAPDQVPAFFMYPGSTDTMGVGTNGIPMPDWRETIPTPNMPDRRGLASMGPITMEAGAEQEILLAYVFARAQTGGAEASVEALKDRVDSVRTFAETIPGIMAPGTPCDQLGVGIAGGDRPSQSLRLYPNPASNIIAMDIGAERGGIIRIFDARGALVLQYRSTRAVISLDVEDLPSGLFHVQVETDVALRNGRFIKD